MTTDDRFPRAIEPGLMPGVVVVHVYRYTDAELLRERRMASLADVEALAGMDADIFGPPVVLCGYDGDDGRIMLPPTLITDDPPTGAS